MEKEKSGSAVKKGLSLAVYFICIAVFGFVFCISMNYSFKCYNSIYIFFYSLLAFIIFVFIYLGLILASGFPRFLSVVIGMFFVLFTVVTFFLNMTCRNDPFSIVDYDFVLKAAKEYAEIGASFDSSYFNSFTVNAFLMLFLSAIIKLSNILNVSYYLLFAIISTVIDVSTMISCAYLAYAERRKLRDAAMAMLLVATFLPLYALNYFLYSDTMTFNIIVVVFSLFSLACNKEKKRDSIILYIVSGAVLAFGILMKFTIVIALIAVALVVVLKLNLRKYNKGLAVATISFLIFYMIGKSYVETRDFVKLAKNSENPVSSWIATGMSEDGSFASAMDYIVDINQMTTKEEKHQASMEYIRNNKDVFGDINHIVKKTERVYGLTSFGTSEYYIIAEPGYEGNRIIQYFNPYGVRYYQILDIICAHFGGILIIYILGIAFEIYFVLRKKGTATLTYVAEIAFIGYFFFLMLSETSHHQLYNAMPLVIVGAVLHLSRISDYIMEKKK